MINYKLIEQLGSGSSGKVYLYQHSKNENLVAVKTIPILRSNKDQTDREIEIYQKTADLMHVPRLIHLFKTTREVFILQEYCEGGTLKKYIQNNPKIPKTIAKKFILDLMKGLKSLHKIGIIHRDIKPDNILLKNNQLKVADFGISKFFLNATSMTMCGTPLYMAPETFNSSNYCLKADIWSLGIVSYEILTGSRPYSASNYQNLFDLFKKNPDYSMLDSYEIEFLNMTLNTNIQNRSSIENLFNSRMIQSYFAEICENYSNLIEYYSDLIHRGIDFVRLGVSIFINYICLADMDYVYYTPLLDLFKDCLTRLEIQKIDNVVIGECLRQIKIECNELSRFSGFYARLLLDLYKFCETIEEIQINKNGINLMIRFL